MIFDLGDTSYGNTTDSGYKALFRKDIFIVILVVAGSFGLPKPGLTAPASSVQRQGATSAAADKALVASIQELLTTLGYEAGPADGVIGKRTRRAIIAFQRKQGLKADGRPSEALYARLTRALNHGEAGRGIAVSKAPVGPASPQEAGSAPNVETAATLATIAPAAGTSGPSKTSSPSPDQIRSVMPPIDREMAHGVRWRITDSNGASFELLLEPGGQVGGIAEPQFWHWDQNGDTIQVIFDNQWGGRVVRTGHIVGDRIIGSAEGNGEKWTWKAVRVPQKPDRAAWRDQP